MQAGNNDCQLAKGGIRVERVFSVLEDDESWYISRPDGQSTVGEKKGVDRNRWAMRLGYQGVVMMVELWLVDLEFCADKKLWRYQEQVRVKVLHRRHRE
jgi:hypothetical protein